MANEKKILVTGSAGFIGGYVVEELLSQGWTVMGIDNFSKYGEIEKSYDSHPNYHFVKGDVKNVSLMKEIAEGCEHILAGAAMIGGISYFHEYAYDLLAENERIMAATFDTAIDAWKKGTLKKITVLSSSMVFESTDVFPSPEGEELKCPPPKSTYGFQKLACEYFAKGAFEQYELPYTIVRPFNCVGIGERRALSDHEIMSGNVKLAMSHVVPDLIQKIVKGQDPLHILGDGSQIRHYTYGGDLARGIRIAIEHPNALNQDFNISTDKSTTVKELAEVIWKKIKGDSVPLRMVSDEPFIHDVQMRVPDCRKAKELLGYEAETGLEELLDEVIPWVTEQVKIGTI
jgi:UDP-glucose 4-epimerase